MAQEQRPMRNIPITDLLAALTAYGLAGPRLLPRADQDRAGLPTARRSWLARCLERTLARNNRGAAPGSSDLDDDWAGGSYARSRRLLNAALHAARQRKGVL